MRIFLTTILISSLLISAQGVRADGCDSLLNQCEQIVSKQEQLIEAQKLQIKDLIELNNASEEQIKFYQSEADKWYTKPSVTLPTAFLLGFISAFLLTK